jgi:hypothetical protein
MDIPALVPGRGRVLQPLRRLSLSLSRQQNRGIPSHDSSSLRDSHFLPGSSLFRVPKPRDRVHFPNLHALHRREQVYTYCVVDPMSFPPFIK